MPLAGEQWANLELLISPPKSSSARSRPPIDERFVLNELDYAIRTNCLHPIFPHKMVLQINIPTCTVEKNKTPTYGGY